jgi:hypothetical protein
MQPEPKQEPVANEGLGVLEHAYAIYRQPDGRYVALHLEGVTAKRVQRIAPNGAPESAPFANQRCTTAMDKRTRLRLWDKATPDDQFEKWLSESDYQRGRR